MLEKARGSLIRAAESGSRHIPRRLVVNSLASALPELEYAICFHRVRAAGSANHLLPGMNFDPAELDAFLELVEESGVLASGARLVVTFDDGYADAAEYVATRARRHPEVDWIFFVCPEKIRKRVGFRWDLFDQQNPGPARPGELLAFLERDLDIDRENDRDDLRAVARLPRFRLASEALCRDLARIPNVRLGNHTNNHFRLSSLPDEVAREEIRRSVAAFEAMFGPTEDLALPFGHPGRDYGEVHLRDIRDAGLVPWTTESRPYRAAERRAEGGLPRVAVGQGWNHRVLAMRMVWQALHQPDGHARP